MHEALIEAYINISSDDYTVLIGKILKHLQQKRPVAYNSLLRLSWESIHAGYYKDVPHGRKDLFGLATFCFVKSSKMLDATFCIDRAVIVCGTGAVSTLLRSLRECGPELTHFSESERWGHIPGYVSGLKQEAVVGSSPKGLSFDIQSFEEDVSDMGKALLCSSSMKTLKSDISIERLKTEVEKGVPFIVRGMCRYWGGIARWKDERFWTSSIRETFVPVEIGEYTHTRFDQAIVSLRDYISYIHNPFPGRKIYLAQYDILDHIDELKRDVEPLPDHLWALGTKFIRPVFIGPQGTVSPFHTDPYDNMFFQIFGKKLVSVEPPKETNPDNEFIHPEYSQMQAVVNPGDCLFIPKLWWHRVESLSCSASIATFIVNQ